MYAPPPLRTFTPGVNGTGPQTTVTPIGTGNKVASIMPGVSRPLGTPAPGYGGSNSGTPILKEPDAGPAESSGGGGARPAFHSGSSGGVGFSGANPYFGRDPVLPPYLEAPGEHEARLVEALQGVRQAQGGQQEAYREAAARAGLSADSPVMQGILGGMMRQTSGQEASIRRNDFMEQEQNRRRREELLAEMKNDLEKQRVSSLNSLAGSVYGSNAALLGSKYGADTSRYGMDLNYDINNRQQQLAELEEPLKLITGLLSNLGITLPQGQTIPQNYGQIGAEGLAWLYELLNKNKGTVGG